MWVLLYFSSGECSANPISQPFNSQLLLVALMHYPYNGCANKMDRNTVAYVRYCAIMYIVDGAFDLLYYSGNNVFDNSMKYHICALDVFMGLYVCRDG